MPSAQDRIRKQVLLRAPRARVWRALTDAREFGSWFGVDLAGAFAPGQTLRGKITHEGYTHLTMEITVEEVEPERRVSWRWHPAAVEPGRDYADEATTLVVFELEDAEGGTRLTVTESGFDGIPLARRAAAFRMNSEGWAAQMASIARHVG